MVESSWISFLSVFELAPGRPLGWMLLLGGLLLMQQLASWWERG